MCTGATAQVLTTAMAGFEAAAASWTRNGKTGKEKGGRAELCYTCGVHSCVMMKTALGGSIKDNSVTTNLEVSRRRREDHRREPLTRMSPTVERSHVREG
jgi:hypothetical protein